MVPDVYQKGLPWGHTLTAFVLNNHEIIFSLVFKALSSLVDMAAHQTQYLTNQIDFITHISIIEEKQC